MNNRAESQFSATKQQTMTGGTGVQGTDQKRNLLGSPNATYSGRDQESPHYNRD